MLLALWIRVPLASSLLGFIGLLYFDALLSSRKVLECCKVELLSPENSSNKGWSWAWDLRKSKLGSDFITRVPEVF